ncbi:MAG: TIGR03936 family radical SAM-associated protein [Acidimicrobiia bacterium]
MSGDRVRLRYTKLGRVRFLGHRDLARSLERALRRADVPVARTGGFSPRAKVSFGLALPTGAESTAEYLDLDLVEGADVDPAGLPDRLSAVLPPGVDVIAAAPVAPGDDSLQHAVTSSEWEVAMEADPLELSAGVDRALAASTLPFTYERKGVQAEADLRPALLSLAVLLPLVLGDAVRLHLELASAAAAGGRTVRPSEVVSALWPHLGAGRVRRVAQWIDRDGVRREPLTLPPNAAVALHASWRAPQSRSTNDGTDRLIRASRGQPSAAGRPHPAVRPERPDRPDEPGPEHRSRADEPAPGRGWAVAPAGA